ncbi:MAG: prepilin-type N-terminal cleavage/methylation domain-containing protein [Planctomycetota bacterium]
MGNLRRGYTLVELLVVIAVASALMATTLAALGAAMQVEREASRQPAKAAATAQLAATLRADVWSAESLALSDAADELTLAQPGGESIRYRRRGDRLHRFLVADGEETPRGVFPAPSDNRLTVDPPSAEAGGWVRIVIEPNEPTQPSLNVRATVGRDLRPLAPNPAEQP